MNKFNINPLKENEKKCLEDYLKLFERKYNFVGNLKEWNDMEKNNFGVSKDSNICINCYNESKLLCSNCKNVF
jgi:hypothetical protein